MLPAVSRWTGTAGEGSWFLAGEVIKHPEPIPPNSDFMLKPPRLEPSSLVGIVAPASPVRREFLDLGVAEIGIFGNGKGEVKPTNGIHLNIPFINRVALGPENCIEHAGQAVTNQPDIPLLSTANFP